MSTDGRGQPLGDHRAYYPWFDWLRAVAAFVVMLAHGSVFSGWESAGNFGVQVFFALSGWLIGGILIDLRPSDMPRFFFNRALRIWAPYYLAVALLLCVSVLREPVTSKWIEFVNYKLLFVYNLFGTRQLATFTQAMPEKGTLNHVWSVNAEEQFYLVAPLLLVLAARRGGRAVSTWVGLTIAAAFFIPYYIAIALGVLAAIWARRFGPVQATAAGRWWLGAVLAASVLGLALAPSQYFLIAPVTGVCIVLLLAVEGRRTALGTVVGGMSYPLYLNHWIGFYAAHWLLKGAPFWIGTLLSSAVSVTWAVVLYWIVDRQMVLWRPRLYTPRRGVAVMGAAYLMIVVGLAYGWAVAGRA